MKVKLPKTVNSEEFRKQQIHFYSLPEWKALRKQVAAESFYICSVCQKPTNSCEGIVHHKIPIDETNIFNPEITLNKDNLMYVCRQCHEKLHEGNKKNKMSQADAEEFYQLLGELVTDTKTDTNSKAEKTKETSVKTERTVRVTSNKHLTLQQKRNRSLRKDNRTKGNRKIIFDDETGELLYLSESTTEDSLSNF